MKQVSNSPTRLSREAQQCKRFNGLNLLTALRMASQGSDDIHFEMYKSEAMLYKPRRRTNLLMTSGFRLAAPQSIFSYGIHEGINAMISSKRARRVRSTVAASMATAEKAIRATG